MSEEFVKENVSVIALDVDGVLNSIESFEKYHTPGSEPVTYSDIPHPDHIRELDRILTDTGAYMLLSSTWRKSISPLMMGMLLHKCGLSYENSYRFIGETPSHGYRGLEIMTKILFINSEKASWHNKYHISKLAILDDDCDMSFLNKYLIKLIMPQV